jgi:hypothetical protein
MVEAPMSLFVLEVGLMTISDDITEGGRLSFSISGRG